jgi:hypothetical protein
MCATLRARSAVFFVLCLGTACRAALPPIRFAPSGTDATRLRSEFALTDAERRALTPENIKSLTQEQVDQIYQRLSSGPIPDGPFRGDLFFPRDRDHHARIRDVADPSPGITENIAAMRLEHLGRVLWKGKAFFRSQGILRNRIDDLAILKPIIKDSDTIPRLTFDGQTTWLLFPARVSCGNSRLEPARRAIVIDYAQGPQIEGYRPIPDKLAGREGLNILDEIRIVRRGFYLGRAYFGQRFALNFTLFDPSSAAETAPSPEVQEDCNASTGNLPVRLDGVDDRRGGLRAERSAGRHRSR